MEVEYWIGGTTGETGFHTILGARFYPRGDPGKKFGNLTTDHQTQVRLFIPNKPISPREKFYSPVWYIVKTAIRWADGVEL